MSRERLINVTVALVTAVATTVIVGLIGNWAFGIAAGAAALTLTNNQTGWFDGPKKK